MMVQNAVREVEEMESELELRELLTTSEAARYLGVHPSTLRNYVRQELLRAFRLHPAGKMFFLKSDLDAMYRYTEYPICLL